MMTIQSVRGAAAIVGTGLAGCGLAPGFDHLDLTALAVKRALDDAGLKLSDVDGLFTANMVNLFAPVVVAEYLGIRPKVGLGTNTGGNVFVDHAYWAALALKERACDVAVICYGSNQRSANFPIMPGDAPIYEKIHGPREPLSSYAMVAARHMHQYGTTREQLADAAVAARQWAMLNPAAFQRDSIERQDVLNSRMISNPLTLMDCCLVTDGAGAIVMTRSDMARDLRQKPVYFLGGATEYSHRQISQMEDLTVTSAAVSSRRAYDMAGYGPGDIGLVQLYDAFTINVVMFLEDLGFCPKGEGGPFVADGNIAPGGRLPVNTNGGGLSCVHPGMYGIFTLIEAAEQLRGTAGERQIDSQLAVCHGNGGLFSTQSTAVLGTEETL